MPNHFIFMLCLPAFFLVLLFLVSRIKPKDGGLHIKAHTVGDGQHGASRWISDKEKREAFHLVDFTPELWRKGKNLPIDEKGEPLQGILCGFDNKDKKKAYIDTGDVHCMMIGAAGAGKTSFWLYPCLEYACATGMSFLTTDTKGDLLRLYGKIAKECYGYHVAVIDLRNPIKSDGNNLLYLVNRSIDLAKTKSGNEQLMEKARAEKYAKIIAKTIILMQSGNQGFGQNAYFYDAAEGLLAAVILLVSEYCPEEERHILSVFRIIESLLIKETHKRETAFESLMNLIPEDHKARWLAGAALHAGGQAMNSVISTTLSRLNSFIDSEMEQLLCFDPEVDAQSFVDQKSAVFFILPEENPNAYFMASLFIQQFYRELMAIADVSLGRLSRRCVFFCDEFGTLPKIESAEIMFSASRSRRLQIVPIIQSFSQLERNYGKEGSDIIVDNIQLLLFGGFAPGSNAAEKLSSALGDRTVLSASQSEGENRKKSISFQMTKKPLMDASELRVLPKGHFIVCKTGYHPMQTKLKLYKELGISDMGIYFPQEHNVQDVHYATMDSLTSAITHRTKNP